MDLHDHADNSNIEDRNGNSKQFSEASMLNDNSKQPKAAKVAEPIKASDDGFVEVTRKHRKGQFCLNKNLFAALKDKEYIFRNNDETWRNTNDIGSSKHDSDSEEVKNVFVKNATFMGGKINTKNVEVPPKKTPRKTGIWTG
ncbi:hypothetical protein Tco_1440249 [Tanacetum coccineum]